MTRPRVLITGFGPFPGVPVNPSAWLVERLVEQVTPDIDAEVHGRILPTEWQATRLMPRLYESLQPHAMIHFGVNQRAKALRIECFAHDRTSPRADAVGALPGSPVIAPAGPPRRDTKLPAATLAGKLRRQGIQAVASRSAGSYLCNFLYYHSLAWARERDCLALFVHIPPFREQSIVTGASEILGFVLGALRKEQLAPRPTLAGIGSPLMRAKEA
jgi:pyroglutamyl-peptidase